jgi:hypothetical protein
MSNASSNVEQRVARWLLMADDRTAGEPVWLTHELIAYMLNTRRAGVTEVLGRLQRQGIIQLNRGSVAILDRNRVEKIAGNFYGLPEKEYVRLVGTYWPPLVKTP